MLLASPGLSDTYRWTDDDGRTIYSQIPPQDGRPYHRVGAPPPPADQQGSREQLDALRKGQAERRDNRELAREQQRKAAEQQATIDSNCETARRNITTLEGNPHRVLRMPDGSIRQLDPQERQSQLDSARNYLEENCR